MIGLRIRIVMTLLVTAGIAGCDGLLDVDLPGSVTEENLTDPRIAETLANSVVGNTGVAWDSYILWATSHSDEWTPASGNAPTKRRSQRQIDPLFAEYVSQLFSPLHRARAEADEFFERIETVSEEDIPRKTEFLARIQAWGTWPFIAFGETFCGTPLDGGDEILTPVQLLAIAETRFTLAIQLATTAGLNDIRLMSLAGRARARLGQLDYAGAIADAELIPDGFVFMVVREAATGRLQNSQYMQINGLPSDGEGRKRASVAPSYWDVRWKGVSDPRVNVQATGTTTYDFFSEHYRHDKVNSADDDIRLASWEEAQLIIAEASALTGDLARARAILDMFHQRAGIPEVTEADIPTQSDVIRHVIEERRHELFTESGARLRDHLKWRGTEFNIPFLGEPGSDAPDGRTIGGELYGDATCFPVPAIELQ
jgi:hypothetical protein